jgi:GNAT superfamily N-acetyltransferase
MEKMENTFTLIEVKKENDIKRFLDFPNTLYLKDESWIRPLNEDIEKVFDPNKNKLFKKGKAIRWIITDADNKVSGRIAAFYDEKSAHKNDQPTGGCGFFDCIDNQDVANILFDAAKRWLENEGMSAMDGPINFGPRDHFWGCLHDGFYEPVYKMPYNHKYYNDLFMSYGFKDFFQQYTFHIPLIPGKLDPVIYEKAKRLSKEPKFTFSNHDTKNPEKSAFDFLEVFNAAWAKFPGVGIMRKAQAKAMFNAMKKIIDPKLIIFGYYEDKPIAFFIMMPDLNQIIKSFNGKFHLFNKLRLIYHLKIRKVCTRAIGLIFGVIPEFQGRGVAEGMILYFEDAVKKGGINYTDLEMNWIGEFNPKMIKLVKQIGGKIRKTHITYRYLFDREKEFVRGKVI